MKLNFEQIKEITLGASYIEEADSKVSFFRFTKEQQELYKETNQDFYNKSFSSTGIKLSFKTDSKNLFIKINTSVSSPRKYFSLDVFANGIPVGNIDNFSDVNLPVDYTECQLPLGEFSKSFYLGEGEKHICVHLPWSVKTDVKEISIDDNSFVEPVKPKHKLLIYGDSITHGYDTLRPSNRYVARLCQMIDAEEFNKGIGAERYFPKLAELKDPVTPDYIMIAYGTNDWFCTNEETLQNNCRAFCENLKKNYPKAKIFVLSPLWRKDKDQERPFGAFENVEPCMRKALQYDQNITVISGYNLVPKEDKYFGDLKLHPNDEGCKFYAENLYEKIKNEI